MKLTKPFYMQLKAWVEKGQEAEAKAKAEAGLAPPPKSAAAAVHAPASSTGGSSTSTDTAPNGFPPGPPTGIPAVFAAK